MSRISPIETFNVVADEHRSPITSKIITDAQSTIDTMMSKPTECGLFSRYVQLFRSGIAMLQNLEPDAAAIDSAAIRALYDIHSQATNNHSKECMLIKARNHEPLD